MTDSGYVGVPGGRVWYRRVGPYDGVPLLCLHGGPGWPHDYLEPIEDLAAHRPVVFYDQLGCGRSDRPADDTLWTADRFVAEVAAVRSALGLDRLHLFGNSWGGMLALQYAVDRRAPLASLITCGSLASVPRWLHAFRELLDRLPDEVRTTIERHEASGFTTCPEYQAALTVFYKRHLCRLDPWPEALERAFAGRGAAVYETMCGPSEFTVVGRLRDWDVTARLDRLNYPTLLMCGRHDECPPEYLAELHARILGSEMVVFEHSAHLPFHEERTLFMDVLADFMARAEHTTA
jgi:proline-specific peptidase